MIDEKLMAGSGFGKKCRRDSGFGQKSRRDAGFRILVYPPPPPPYKHVQPAVITFDQPVFWKASIIVHESLDIYIKEITLLRGTFHTTMNLLGCIGVIMENSGLTNVLEQIYGVNTVQHMLSGKAYSRALRGHLIVDTSLNTLIARDKLDTRKVISYLQEINPFSNSDSILHNIASGVTADNEVDVCDFISIGGKVLEKMESAEIFTISFKK